MPPNPFSTLVPCRLGLSTTQDFSSRANTLERALKAGAPGNIVLADAAYGDNTIFRNAIRYL
jgi:hypothetical protein